MTWLRTLRHSVLWLLLFGSLLASGWQVLAIYGVYRDNQLLHNLISGTDVDVSQVISGKPELRLGRAYYLKQKHRYDEALATLSLIMEQGDNTFKARTRYNIGNIYLEQALDRVEAMNINEALPLVGLAKQAY
ncbi:MAG: MxaK protein, partial [Methylococcales bacterium]